MEFQFSDMVNQFQTGIFAMLNEKKEELTPSGKRISVIINIEELDKKF